LSETATGLLVCLARVTSLYVEAVFLSPEN